MDHAPKSELQVSQRRLVIPYVGGKASISIAALFFRLKRSRFDPWLNQATRFKRHTNGRSQLPPCRIALLILPIGYLSLCILPDSSDWITAATNVGAYYHEPTLVCCCGSHNISYPRCLTGFGPSDGRHGRIVETTDSPVRPAGWEGRTVNTNSDGECLA